MPTEQKQPTKSPEERTADVAGHLTSLNWMKGYPTDLNAIKMIAKAVAKFAQTVEVNHGNAEYPSKLDLGWVVPIEWLVGEVASTMEFFPMPIQMRRIYETRFAPLDKRSADDLTEPLER